MTGERAQAAAAAMSKLLHQKAMQLQRMRGDRAKPIWAEPCPSNFASDMRPSRTRSLVRLKHLLYMAGEVPRVLEGDSPVQAMLFIGFIQGALWALGLATLEDLKLMNLGDGVPPLPMKEAVRLARSELARIVGQEPRQPRIEEVHAAKPEILSTTTSWLVTLSSLETDEHRKYHRFAVSWEAAVETPLEETPSDAPA